MYEALHSARFPRDIKLCKKKRWEIDALKRAIVDLQRSDECALDSRYRAHALRGSRKGEMAIHVPSRKHPPKDSWVLIYRIRNGIIYFERTGTHDIY